MREMMYKTRSFTHLFLLQSFLLVQVLDFQVNYCEGGTHTGFEFLDWGKPCKIPKPGEILRPKDECDTSRGILK